MAPSKFGSLANPGFPGRVALRKRSKGASMRARPIVAMVAVGLSVGLGFELALLAIGNCRVCCSPECQALDGGQMQRNGRRIRHVDAANGPIRRNAAAAVARIARKLTKALAFGTKHERNAFRPS